MTRDELLAEIENFTVIDSIFMKDVLRAVVDFHEPFEFTWGEEKSIACYCGEMYPCPTIRTIEEELE
jgi:hypothetical protein